MLFERAVTPDHVKAECERRITERYPLGKQNTITLRGGPERDDMLAFIEAMIAASHRLEAQVPIPADYRHDEHWS
ncbi:hypothetical protein SAMN05216456_1897 [Devosia crocina]|uniref:Uncharacterized protein n=1 Tax=Devosia crocina TaxID=429728 RepID=A0A1I7NF15_9HYPH|nr:hypothetical protein [Devosia crocina]SFV33136.1 hypothetical protein SAMN05216456_1897 [Devosia crocina]